MNLPVYCTDEAPRDRLFEIVRKYDGTPKELLVHPSRWDEYLAAITAVGVPIEDRPPEIRELLELVRSSAS